VTSATDPLAFGVLQSLLQHGIRVPADISLVGYDDIPFARYLSVPLTTVRRPHYEMGTVAAQMLTGVLAGVAPEQRHVIFQPEFVLRDSTDSPTAGAIEDLDNGLLDPLDPRPLHRLLVAPEVGGDRAREQAATVTGNHGATWDVASIRDTTYLDC
jgi:hypothetical protein